MRGAVLALMLVVVPAATAAQDKQPPYWASIASGEAMMRVGPGKNFPGVWLYKRRDLPVRVLQIQPNWRLIEDPDGTRGWMLVTLLSDRRTAILKGAQPRPVRAEANLGSRIRYMVQPGVVGRIDACAEGWCHISFGAKDGHVRVSDLWGVGPEEVID